MRRIAASVIALSLSFTAISCNSHKMTVPNIATAVFAPGLDVDISTMTKTADGLYYKDLVVGTGAEATNGKTITAHYTGWLADGTQFGSSVEDGEPLEFVLGSGRVIDGWDKGFVGMKAGGKRKLVIPPSLGYGSRSTGPIPGNSILVFDVELLSVR